MFSLATEHGPTGIMASLRKCVKRFAWGRTQLHAPYSGLSGFPAPAVAAQFAAILSVLVATIAFLGRDELDAVLLP
jgi:hypothetical protein